MPKSLHAHGPSVRTIPSHGANLSHTGESRRNKIAQLAGREVRGGLTIVLPDRTEIEVVWACETVNEGDNRVSRDYVVFEGQSRAWGVS